MWACHISYMYKHLDTLSPIPMPEYKELNTLPYIFTSLLKVLII